MKTRHGPVFAAGWRQRDLRKLMSELPAAELALAGHAVALAAWHEVHTDCHTRPLAACRLCKSVDVTLGAAGLLPVLIAWAMSIAAR